jgi:hypothetical protein
MQSLRLIGLVLMVVWGCSSNGMTAAGGRGSGGMMAANTGSGGVVNGGATGTGGLVNGGATGTGGLANGGTTGTGGLANGGATGTGGTSAGTDAGPDTAIASGEVDVGSDVDTAAAACGKSEVSPEQAAAAFVDYLAQSQPGGGTNVFIDVVEQSVPGLWDQMNAQLFTATVYTDTHIVWYQCSFIYRDCTVTLPESDYINFGPIISGVANGGAYYYSWPVGSGIPASILGKLAVSGGGLGQTVSQTYHNGNTGVPRRLVVTLEGDKLVVYRANVSWGHFNDWQNPELIGPLADFGDRLGILDSNGRELSDTIP